MASSLLLLALLLGSGCAPSTKIPGTHIPDTEENRQVLTVLERYRIAFVRRDAAGVLATAHPTYYDIAGTDDPADDVVYEELGPLLRRRMEQLESVRYTIDYLEIFIDRDRAVVKVWIDASFRLSGEAELENQTSLDPRYARKQDYAEFELLREGDNWMITKGL